MASDRSAERNFLFGMLALQNAFITRDQLVSAFGSWAADKRHSIDQILQDLGALDEATRQLIAALVERHLERHNNDALQSLAKLSSIGPSARQSLEQLNDDQLKSCLSQLPPVDLQKPYDEFATVVPPVGQSSASGRFIILRPHAKGGLGQVSVALDTELHREVALKEIQPSHADEPSAQTRFVREAEITGGLEHPGIVPVYGLGSYADGRPYYAMKFVKGRSLKTALEEFHAKHPQPTVADYEGVEFRQLLQRFLDVCNAIQYAHDRGVLHRDLKPGNIMLGQYGETLVIDWGLAKPLGETDTDLPRGTSGEVPLVPHSSLTGLGMETQAGSTIGTLSYMSPEQALGELNLGPATDVYSLGATLYHLLAGQPSIEHKKERQFHETLAAIQQGTYPPPRDIKPHIPKSLDAICRKAMAVEISQRYAGPQDLARDLEHWLADEEIAAAPDTRLAAISRTARRHRGIVATALMSLLVISIGASTAGLFIRSQQLQALELARQEQLARQQAETALAARDDALERMARTDDGSLPLDAALQELRDDPAFLTLRMLLLQRTEQDLTFVSQASGGNTPQLAAAHGYLLLQVAQLETERAKRVETANRAVDALEIAARLNLDDLPLMLRLSDALNLRAQFQAGPAQRLDFEQCLKIRTALKQRVEESQASDEQSVEIHRKWLSIRHNLALLNADVAELNRIAEERRKMTDQFPTNHRLMKDLADSEMILARLETGSDPIAHFQQAAEFYRLADEGNLGSVVRSRRAEALRNTLECELAAHDLDGAQRTADQILQLSVQILRNSDLKDFFARGFFSSGSVAFETWRADQTRDSDRVLAAEHLRLAVLLYQELARIPGVESHVWYDLAAAAELRGKVLEGSPSELALARRMYELARQSLETLKSIDPRRFETEAVQLLWNRVLERLLTLPEGKNQG